MWHHRGGAFFKWLEVSREAGIVAVYCDRVASGKILFSYERDVLINIGDQITTYFENLFNSNNLQGLVAAVGSSTLGIRLSRNYFGVIGEGSNSSLKYIGEVFQRANDPEFFNPHAIALRDMFGRWRELAEERAYFIRRDPLYSPPIQDLTA